MLTLEDKDFILFEEDSVLHCKDSIVVLTILERWIICENIYINAPSATDIL